MADVWGLVPTLTTTEALCLLALNHIEDTPTDGPVLDCPRRSPLMAEMPTYTLTYNARPMSLNVERKGNRFQRAPLVKEWRDAYRWLAAEDRIPPLQWIHVEARPQYRTARSLPDTAACVGSVKAAIDGLVDAGVLPDDGPELVRRVTFHAPTVDRSLHSDRLVLTIYGPVA